MFGPATARAVTVTLAAVLLFACASAGGPDPPVPGAAADGLGGVHQHRVVVHARRLEAADEPPEPLGDPDPTVHPAREVRWVPAAGRADVLATPTDERFRYPVDNPVVTSPFGPRRDPIDGRRRRLHRGVDFRGATGTPVYATASGEVLMAGWCDRGTGNCVVIQHPGGWRSQYFHLSAVYVDCGPVSQGEQIGDIGSTGRSTGPHLHFQISRDDRDIDPLDVMGERLARQ